MNNIGKTFEEYLKEEASSMPMGQPNVSPDMNNPMSQQPQDQSFNFHMHNAMLDKVYDRYMPYILNNIKTPNDFKQLMPKIHFDLQNHKLASSSVNSQMNNMRGRDLGRYGQNMM